MVFKKPYAFLIKYFRLINMILSSLLVFLCYRLNLLRIVLNNIYIGRETNYSLVQEKYIGFLMYFLVFLIAAILIIIIILLKKKKKPLNDYLYNIIYLAIILAYLLSVDNLLTTLDDSIVEQTTLKLFTDISFLVIIPIFYFILKHFLIVIGFNLKKFNFAKDIIELKQEEKDNEVVEIDFDKHTYKYKRFIRRKTRELKYYFLENRLFILIIVGVVILVLGLGLIGSNIFKTNVVSVNKSFTANGFSYNVRNVYDTIYDLNGKRIKNDTKFILVEAEIINLRSDTRILDLKTIRLFYNNEYTYATDYFNSYFNDLGNVYNRDNLINGQKNTYVLVFQVPDSIKSSRYKLKFYDKITYDKSEVNGSYKELNIKSVNLDKPKTEIKFNMYDTISIENLSGTELSIREYSLSNNYFSIESTNKIIKSGDINKTLLIMDYSLNIKDSNILDDEAFFNKYFILEYDINSNTKTIKNVEVAGITDDKVMIKVPLEVTYSQSIRAKIIFRDKYYVATLK